MTVNWGILGCGGIANKFALSAAEVDKAAVVAAASRTEGRAEAFAAKHGIDRYYDNYADLLADPEVDAVYVATTHNFHFENVREVLQAGKPVLCEKPFTVNSTEMKHLVSLAREKDLFMMEAMWTRFLPAIVRIRELLADRVLGDIKQIHATFGFQMPFDPDHRLYNPELAGGALLDAGIYPLSFANMIAGTAPEEIRAVAEIGSTGVDEQSCYLLRYPGGTLAVLTSAVNAPVVSRAEIIGTKGRITIPEKFLAADGFILEINGEEPEEFPFPFDEDKGFRFEIEAASSSIRNKEKENAVMPLSDTLVLQETFDEIKKQVGLVYANDRNPLP